MLTTCDRYESLMQLLLDGRISKSDRDALDRHLAECDACVISLNRYRAVAAASVAWARPVASDEPGDAFNESVLAAIGTHAKLQPVRLDWRWTVAAAGLAIIAIAAGATLPHGLLTWPAAVSLHGTPDWLRLPSDMTSASALTHFTLADLAAGVNALATSVAAVKLPAWAGAVCAAGIAVNLWFIRKTVTTGRAELS